ncbi:zinc-dependent metalloprotease [Mesoterricola sediminis]|uniref:Glutaminyl-tRNA synthetase n=1 Tax=Mesoterricola sediminis TaxID=2927980 RepID=A0AA48GYV8_9BACT|nr:zinc-dependent metalloprotease [Mesoterricola sediminis]BDU78160.1 glutaminyl-tRNA synthetase [Mesoterricola sediminis]
MPIPALTRVMALLVAANLCAAPPRPAAPKGEARTPPAVAPRPEAPRSPEGEPRPFDKVVTADFKTQEGLFRVHSHKGRHLFEIPKAELGREMLLIASVKASPAGVGYPGQGAGSITVRWELREHKVLLRLCSHVALVDPASELAPSVKAMGTETIMAAFPVETFGKDGAPVVDLTRFFSGDIGELHVKQAVQGSMADPGRSFIEQVRAFPENLNIETLLTYNPAAMPPLPGVLGHAGVLPSPPARTAVVVYSMVRLPATPMMPRLADERVGYFGQSVLDFAKEDHEASRRAFIARWRLEKKDPAAERSEPVKPIVFYIDPATPAKWVPFIKRAVEAWQPAFEAAGFLNAIQAREAPRDDPAWSMDDARYSCIRWIPSTTANAMGPHVSDPRSGEILEAKIEIYHNVLQIASDWYFTQVAPLDPRARTLPLPDDLMGDILAFVVTHEVGHSLGLAHNFKASSAYTLAQIRDKAWVKRNGHVPSIMDYSRFNYVAQPEDGLDPADLIPRIGAYDRLAIQWGYTPVPGAARPEDEKAFLAKLLEPQKNAPWLQFSNPRAEGTDPGDQAEAVGDIDAVKATALGLRNLKRVMDLLPGATLKPGENLDKLARGYEALLDQWSRELGHVAALVGGWTSTPRFGTDPGVQFTPVSRERQQEAVRFLNEQLFRTPAWILREEILRKLEPGSGQVQLLGVQRGLLNALLAPSRTSRLEDQEAVLGAKAYTAAHLLADLRKGIFSELQTGTRVDPYRRNLQRAFLEVLASRLAPAPAQTLVLGPQGPVRQRLNPLDDTRGAVRAELKAIQALCARPAADRATAIHQADLKDQIARYLDPRASAPAAASAPAR